MDRIFFFDDEYDDDSGELAKIKFYQDESSASSSPRARTRGSSAQQGSPRTLDYALSEDRVARAAERRRRAHSFDDDDDNNNESSITRVAEERVDSTSGSLTIMYGSMTSEHVA